LTVFVYDAAGQLAAEYSTQIETESPKVSYLTTDHLGSPRIATDAGGGAISRRDFTAFGEEVVTAQRTGSRNSKCPAKRQRSSFISFVFNRYFPTFKGVRLGRLFSLSELI
jgi:hypothetical protein